MSEPDELRNLQQQFMAYVLGKEPSAHIDREPSAHINKEPSAHLDNEPSARLSKSRPAGLDKSVSSQTIIDKIESNNVLSAQGRLGIYASAYRMRLVEAIATDFENLHSYLGDQQFHELAESYIDSHPSHTTNLRYYSEAIPDWLSVELPFSKLPVLAEIALIEKAFADSFDAADANVVSMEQLSQLPPQSWPDLQFDFHPSLQILSQNTNSFPIWKALAGQQTPPAICPLDETAHWALWRKTDLVSHYRPLSMAEAKALMMALKKNNFAQICEELQSYYSAEETPLKALGFLQMWIEEQMLCALVSG